MRTHLSAFRFHGIGHEKGPPKQRLLDDEYELLGGSGFKLTSPPSQAGNPKPESASKSPNDPKTTFPCQGIPQRFDTTLAAKGCCPGSWRGVSRPEGGTHCSYLKKSKSD